MHRGLLHVQGLLVASLVMMGSEAFAQGLCPAPTRVQTTPQPLPRERASSDSDRPATSETVEVSSDGAALNLDGDALLSGRVEIRQGGRELSAEEVDYDSQSGVFAIGGAVRYRDAQVIASGQSGRYSSGEGAQIDNARFELPERRAQGAADTLTIGIDGTLGLESVWFRELNMPPESETLIHS